MKFRGLSAAVVVLAVLGGLLWWSQRHKPAPSTAASGPALLTLKPSEIASFTLKAKGAQAITLVQSPPGLWKITAPASYAADSSAVNELTASLTPLHAQRIVEDQASNLSQFGLAEPALEIDIDAKKGGATRLLLGDHTPTGDAVYAVTAGNQHLYTVADSIESVLNKKLPDLRDRRLIPIASGEVNSIDLVHDRQTISFARGSSGWKMEKPQPYRTDDFQVDDLLEQVVGARWRNSDNSNEDAKAYAHGSPFATVKLTGSFGTDTLDVRKGRGHYYAKSSAIQGIWQIQPALVSALDRGPDDFRNKQLLDIGYGDPSAITYHAEGINLNATRAGKVWYANGHKLDSSSVESLVSALRDLAASKFVTTGYTKSDIELTVTFPGKPVEEVQFQKVKGGAIARRGDGPSFYFLDSVTMQELYSAASGVKPAGAAEK